MALEAMPEDWARALAVVAHPDDLEYGAASAIARFTAQGKDVRYVLVTRGEAGIASRPPQEVAPLRTAEQIAAFVQFDRALVQVLAEHLVQWASTPTMDGATLLDHTRVLIVTNYGVGETRFHTAGPVMAVAVGGGGTMVRGTWVVARRPYRDFLTTVAASFGVPNAPFGTERTGVLIDELLDSSSPR